MAFNFLNSKAQTIIEFLLVLFVFLLFVQGAIVPLFNDSRNSLLDVSSSLLGKTALNKIYSSAIELSDLSGESQKKVIVFLNENQTIKCSTANNSLQLIVSLKGSGSIEACPDSECLKEMFFPSNISLSECFNDLNGAKRKSFTLIIRKNTDKTISITELQ